MEIYSIVRGLNGMHYGVHEQQESVVRYLIGPDTFTGGLPEIRNRVMELQNQDPKLYKRVNRIALAMRHDDESTWDFPIEEIEQ